MAESATEPQQAAEQESAKNITGVISRILHHKEETGFSLFIIEIGKQTHKLVGVCPGLKVGMRVTAEGEFQTDPRYGDQFNFTSINLEEPNDALGMIRYLSSGVLPGVGEALAKRMVDAFGDKTYDVITSESYKLLRLSGFTEKRVAAIEEAWLEEQATRELRTFLMKYGVGPATANKISKQIDDVSVEMIQQNPYIIARVDGVGFKTADRMALSLSIAEDSNQRIIAAIKYTLLTAETSGHNYLEIHKLAAQTKRLLGSVLEEVISRHISSMSLRGDIEREVFDGEIAIYSKNMGRHERETAERLVQISWNDFGNEIDATDQDIAHYEARHKITFSPSQRQALKSSLGSKVAVLTGGPGTGKTTIVDAFLEISSRYCGREVSLAAPTGRAAQRLAESTNQEATTIHRLMGAKPDGSFNYHKANKLKGRRFVVDESSMVGQRLFSRLLAAINDDANILLVGDTNQLPSVDAGRVLGDIINSGEFPVCRLTEVHRQAQDSRIVMAAHTIINNKVPELSHDLAHDLSFITSNKSSESAQDDLVNIYLNELAEQGFDPLKDIQILTPIHRGELGTEALNIRLQKELNPNIGKGIRRFGGFEFCLGDKVMQTRNDSQSEIYNGDIGYVTEVDLEGMRLKIDFNGREVECKRDMLDNLTLAYAVTIHKSQGSEYPAVIMPMTMEHRIMLRRELIYTGLTRGKSKVVMVGDKRAFEYAVMNHAQDPKLLRNSHLEERINLEMGKLRNDKAVNMRPLLGSSGRSSRP